ncbi:MAG: hypothetical protein HQL97_05115 [Magnetococcales bacterium]|nr:hypothetical protein [Magnetococcales bacterium]
MNETVMMIENNMATMTKISERVSPPVEGILIIDLEASGLHSNSYPTEIAWMDPIKDEKVTSYLIQPSQCWLETFWDPKAEAITGITRSMIIHDGCPIQDIAQFTIEAMRNAPLILTDAPGRDAQWMRVLLEAAKVAYKPPPFMEYQEFMWRWFNSGVLLKGKRIHRAGQDVERMATAFKIAANVYPSDLSMISTVIGSGQTSPNGL